MSGLEEPLISTFELYPDPARDAITGHLDGGEGPSTLVVLDALGSERGRYAVNNAGSSLLALDGPQAGP